MELMQVVLCIAAIICVSIETSYARETGDIQRLDELLDTVVSFNDDSQNSRDIEAEDLEDDFENLIEEQGVSSDSSKHLQKLIRTKRGKREAQTDTEMIIKLLNNISQKQNLLMKNQKQIMQTLDENQLVQKINTMSDVTSIIAAALVNKNNVPFIPSCQETVKEGHNDIDTCLQPQIAQLYPYLGIPVRLVGSPNPNEGRVEVYYKGRYTTVCDHGWDRADARVVCKSLGYTGRATAFDGPRFTWGHKFGEGEGLIMIYLVNCKGDEDSLLSCEFRDPAESWTCIHGDDAGVKCQQE